MANEKKSEPPMDAYPPAEPGYPVQQPGSAPPPYYQPPPGQQGQGYPPQQGYAYPPQPTVGYAAPQEPGQTVIVRTAQVQPNDYLALAICVTICCCLPFGIVGIVKASESRSRFQAGDYEGAEESSKAAKNWSVAGLVTGCILVGGFLVFYVLIYVVIIGAALANPSYY